MVPRKSSVVECWLLVCAAVAVGYATGAKDCRHVRDVSCAPWLSMALGGPSTVSLVEVHLLKRPKTENMHLKITFPNSTTDIHEVLPNSEARVHISPPVTSSAVWVLSSPAVCLRITVTACPVEPTLPSLPSLPLGYHRLTRALAAGSRNGARPPPPPKPYSWLQLSMVVGASVATLALLPPLLILTFLCCQKHRKLGDVESPFSKHNPMDSIPQSEKERESREECVGGRREKVEENHVAEKEVPLMFGRHPLGSPTYSTFQSLEELDSPLPTILTPAHTSLTSTPSSLTTKQTEAEQMVSSPTASQERPNSQTVSLEATPTLPIIPSPSHPSTSHPSTSSQHPSTSSQRPSTSSQHPSTFSQRPSTSSQHPCTSSQHPSTSSQHPSTFSQRPSTSSQRPSTSSQHPSTSSQHPSTSSQHPSTSSQHPSTSSQHPSTSSQHPSTSSQHPSTSSHPSTASHPSVSSHHSVFSHPSVSSHLSISSCPTTPFTPSQCVVFPSECDTVVEEQSEDKEKDHEESIYYRMESKQSSLTLPSQDSQGESSLDCGVRNSTATREEEEGESSLDKGMRTPVLCTRVDSGETSLDRGPRQPDAVLKCQSSPIRSPFVKDAPVSPVVPAPISPSVPLPIPVPPPISPSVLHPIPVPPPIPPREPSDASPPAVLCSVCGQEIKELPRNEEGEPFYLVLSSHRGETDDQRETEEKSQKTASPGGFQCRVLESGTAMCLECSTGTVSSKHKIRSHDKDEDNDELADLPPPIPPRDNPPAKANDPVYERVGSLRNAAKEPLGPKLSTNSEAYCSIDSINAKASKPKTLPLQKGSTSDYATIPSLNSSSPYYHKASEIQQIMAMYSERTECHERPPHLSTLRSESSSSNGSHDYESLPSSFDQGRAILVKRDSEDYAKIGPAPADSEEALDEAERNSVLKIDAHGYALVMERRATANYKVTDADEAWRLQQTRGYAPLTPTRKSRSSQSSEQGSFPSPIPRDYEVPVSLPSPRLVRQRRLSSTMEETEDMSDHVFSEEQKEEGEEKGGEEEEELMEQNSSTVELLQADDLRTAEATSAESVVPGRPRAKTVGAQEACAVYRDGTHSQRKSLPSTLHICLDQESSVVI